MEYIYIDKIVDTEKVKSFLKELFPALKIFYWSFEDESPFDFNDEDENIIFFNYTINPERSEFQVSFSIYRTPTINQEERALFIAKKLSDSFEIRTLVPIEDVINKYPYLNIVFKNNKTYLVDDSLFNWAGGEGETLQIIEEYELPNILFDSKANLIAKIG